MARPKKSEKFEGTNVTPLRKNSDEMTVDATDLQKMLDTLAGLQTTVGEATGSLRAKLKAILDETGYHKSALAHVRSIDAMSPTKRADYLRTMRPMMEVMWESFWRDESQDLLHKVENESKEMVAEMGRDAGSGDMSEDEVNKLAAEMDAADA